MIIIYNTDYTRNIFVFKILYLFHHIYEIRKINFNSLNKVIIALSDTIACSDSAVYINTDTHINLQNLNTFRAYNALNLVDGLYIGGNTDIMLRSCLELY